MKNATITIELTREHANAIIKALDFYSRIGSGQLEEILNLARLGEIKDKGGCLPILEDIKKAELSIHDLKRDLFGYVHNASHSICSPHVPDIYKTAYDIECVLRRWSAEVENHIKYSVWRDEPLHTNKKVPLIKVVERS